MPLTEFGPLQHLSAEAVGQPGQRRFRLRAINDDGAHAFVWMEKEQLAAIGEAIGSTLADAPPPAPAADAPEPVFPLRANHELDVRAGRLSLGLNEETRRIVILCAEAPAEGEGDAISFEFGFDAAHRLRAIIEEVVAAGRPPCRFCGAPVDPAGHVCPRANGHRSEE